MYLERARALREQHGETLADATVADAGRLARELGPIAGRLQQREPELPPEAAPDVAATLLAEALLVALADAGWTVEAPLAEPVSARRGDLRLGPYETVARLREDGVAAAGWPERAAALGIAELPLLPARDDDAAAAPAGSRAA